MHPATQSMLLPNEKLFYLNLQSKVNEFTYSKRCALQSNAKKMHIFTSSRGSESLPHIDSGSLSPTNYIYYPGKQESKREALFKPALRCVYSHSIRSGQPRRVTVYTWYYHVFLMHLLWPLAFGFRQNPPHLFCHTLHHFHMRTNSCYATYVDEYNKD